VASTKPGTTAASASGRGAAAIADAEKVADRRARADRRQAPRLKMPKVQAEIVSLGLPVTVLEVGFGGLSVASGAEFSVGEVLELSCWTSKAHPVVLRVEVRHCRPDAGPDASSRYITGFQFIEMWSPGDHSPVDALMERIITVLSVDTDR
jgi:hypothetical protein